MRDAACRDLVECTRRIAAGALQKIPCPFEFALRRTLCPESEVMATSLAELAKRVMSVQIQRMDCRPLAGRERAQGAFIAITLDTKIIVRPDRRRCDRGYASESDAHEHVWRKFAHVHRSMY